MRKLALLFLSVFHFTTTGFSQEITVGFRTGNNTSKLYGDYGKNRENTDYPIIASSFPSYGLFLNYKVNKTLSTQFEVNSRTKRMFYTNKEGQIGASWGGESNFNYIEVPLLAKLSLGKRFKGFINAGPVLNVLVSGGNYKYYTWGSHRGGVHNHYNRNIKSDFNLINVGILGGVGFEWNIFNNFVLLGEARFTNDLSNAAKKNDYTDPNTGGKWYYNTTRFFVFATDIGIAYRFGKH